MLIILLLSTALVSAEERTELEPVESSFPVKVSGFIKHESYWDTRQVVGAQDDQILLFPEKKKLDANCDDINGKGQYDMVAIQTRMRFDITGPNIKNAHSHGVIEFDFFGKTDLANIVRMRHAHIILTWEDVKMTFGQAYHPLYVIGIDPRTLSFNTGIPLDTFSRNPQFRITWTPHERLDLIFCASTELDFASDGPIGKSTTYMRNAIVPMLDFQFQTRFGKSHLFGMGVDYKRIWPRLETDTGLKANESLNSFIFIAFNRLEWSSFNSRTKFLFVQNPTDQNMIGGYAVHSVDPITDRREYTNLNGIGVWNDSDITKSKSLVPGWFIGFLKNIGARKTILPNVVDSSGNITDRRIFGDGTDIDYLFRFAPRLRWNVNNFMLAAEVEYTRAAFGTIDSTGNVINTDPVGVTRFLITLYYFL